MQTFLGLHLATPIPSYARATNTTTESVNGTPDYSESPNARVRVTAGVRPDYNGVKNLVGKVRAHMRKHKTNVAFEEVCPQPLGTLSAAQQARTVNAKVDAGESVVRASGSIDGLLEGRWINFGTARRLYMVQDIDADTNEIELDIPLVASLARGTTINFTPTARWHWTPAAFNDPPGFDIGINSGIDWLLSVIEAT